MSIKTAKTNSKPVYQYLDYLIDVSFLGGNRFFEVLLENSAYRAMHTGDVLLLETKYSVQALF